MTSIDLTTTRDNHSAEQEELINRLSLFSKILSLLTFPLFPVMFIAFAVVPFSSENKQFETFVSFCGFVSLYNSVTFHLKIEALMHNDKRL